MEIRKFTAPKKPSGEIITNIRNANPIIVDIVDGEEEVVPFAVMSISG